MTTKINKEEDPMGIAPLMKHMGLPWEILAESGEGWIANGESDNGEIRVPFKMPAAYAGESSDDLENARFICKAVNVHYQQLEMLKDAYSLLSELRPEHWITKHIKELIQQISII